MPCGVCQEARETAKVVAGNVEKALEEANEQVAHALEEAQKKAADQDNSK